MLSFHNLEIKWKNPHNFILLDDSNHTLIDKFNRTAKVFSNISALHIYYDLQNDDHNMIIKFSFHGRNHTPQKLDENVYNCSVSYFDQFYQHLACNFEIECDEKQDERKCNFTSPKCDGAISIDNKCYVILYEVSMLSALKARYECKKRGLEIASFPVTKDLLKFVDVVTTYNRSLNLIIGLTMSEITSPHMFMYR